MLPETETYSQTLPAMPRRPLYLAAAASTAAHGVLIAALLMLDNPLLPDSGNSAAALDVALSGRQVSSANRAPAGDEPGDGDAAPPSPPAPSATAPEPLPSRPAPPDAPRRPMDSRMVVSQDSDVLSVETQVDETSLQSDALPENTAADALRMVMRDEERRMLRDRMKQWRQRLPELISRQEPMRWQHDGQSWEARAERLPARDGDDLERARIEVSTRRDGATLSTSMQFKRLAFSHYAQFINHWDENVALSQDRIDGRFHANTAVTVGQGPGEEEPRFSGPATIAAVQPRSHSLQRSGIFAGGLQTRAQRMPLPRDALPFSTEEQSAPESVHHFERDSEIVFHAGGEYHWKTSGTDRIAGRRPTGNGTVHLVAREDVVLSVRGRVAGRVVVYSPRRITINGDLRYARDPRTEPDSGDFLSLISDHTIQVAHPEVTGGGNLHIDAVLFAGRRFSVRRFRGPEQGVMSIYGSVTAGSVSATEPRYATHIRFDPRLEDRRAPGVPMTERFELDSWQQNWQVSR